MINVSDVSDEEIVEDGPLQFSDVEPYLQKIVQTDDPQLHEYLAKIRNQAAKNRVQRVNTNYKKLRKVWPEGTPIDFFVAFEMFANQSDKELRIELTNPQNIQKVIAEVENRKKGNPSVNQLIKQSHFFTLLDESSSETSEESQDNESSGEEDNYSSNTRKYTHWSDEDMRRFISVLKHGNKKLTWTMVAQQFPGHNRIQCHSYYYRLKREKKINFSFQPKKDPNETKFQANSTDKDKSSQKETENINPCEYKNLKALVLLCGEQKAIVGPITTRFKDLAIQNPLSEYNDTLTGQPLFIPAISPYGTVLNYDTWMTIMNKDRIDPNIRRVIRCKSDIKIITYENFDQYKGKIRNLPDFVNNEDNSCD